MTIKKDKNATLFVFQLRQGYFLSIAAKKFNRIPQLEVNIDEEGNKLRGDFNTFISGLVSNLSDRRDQEEMNIMNMRS